MSYACQKWLEGVLYSGFSECASVYAFGFIMPITSCAMDEEEFSVDLFSCRKMARNARLKLPPHLFKYMNLKVK